jgi:hypothetical protein
MITLLLDQFKHLDGFGSMRPRGFVQNTFLCEAAAVHGFEMQVVRQQ